MNTPPVSTPLFDRQLAFVGLRVIAGINMLMHGLVRLPDLTGFADGLASTFEPTILPELLVRPFAYVLTFAEFIVGLLLVVGWQVRWALVGCLAIMAALVFGTALRQEWATLSTQMIYALTFFALLMTRGYDRWGLDERVAHQTDGRA